MAESNGILARVHKVRVGGIDIARLDLDATADLMVRVVRVREAIVR